MTEALPIGVGHNLPPTDFETLRERVEELAQAARSWEGIIEIAGREQAERADTFLSQIGSFSFRKTDKGVLHKLYDEKEHELQPHRDAQLEIKNRYDPVMLTALRAKEIVNKLLQPYLRKQQAKLKEAGAPPTTRAGVRGEYSTRTRTLSPERWEVEITDALLTFVYYQEQMLVHPDFLALLRRLARHEARDTKGRRPIPGVRIVPSESAA